MYKLLITKAFCQVAEGACSVWVAQGTISNDNLNIALIGDLGRSAAMMMKEGESYYVIGHFKPAPHLGYDNLFIITDISLGYDDVRGKNLNYYA